MGVPKEVLVCRVACGRKDDCPALFRLDKYRPIFMTDRSIAESLVGEWTSRYPSCQARVETVGAT